MKILFVDFDGCTNIHDWCILSETNPIHRNLIQHINTVNLETGARVVVTSAWRYLVHNGWMTDQGFDYMLRVAGLWSHVFIGITRLDDGPLVTKNGMTYPECDRGKQISDWLRDYGDDVTHYCVIDDLGCLGIEEAGHPFVQINPATGITDANVECIIEILSK